MNFTELLIHSLDWIQQNPWLGALWFIILYTLTCVIFLPGSLLTIGAGAVYGFWISTLLVTVSSTVGAIVNFLTSRYIARRWMERKLGNDPKFHALEKAVGARGWKLIMISRISPVVPHSLVSYASGLTRISFWRFTMASVAGFLPLSAAYSYAGAFVSQAIHTTVGLKPHDPISWTFYVLGMVATIVAMIMTTRAASRALKKDSANDLRENPASPAGRQDTLDTDR